MGQDNDMLAHLGKTEKQNYSTVIQFRVTKELKTEVRRILEKRNLDLSMLLRSYLYDLVKNQSSQSSSPSHRKN